MNPLFSSSSLVSESASRLSHLGFSSFFQRALGAHLAARRCDHGDDSAPSRLAVGRVALEHRGGYVLLTGGGEVGADLAGRLRHAAASRLDLPAVGDWVVYLDNGATSRATVDALLPRRTAFVRAVAGGVSKPQIVAANVDVVFLVGAAGHDFNVRRFERYLAVARASGASPVVVVTKADLASDCARLVADATAVASGAPVHAVSSLTGDGVNALRAYFADAATVAVVGSSGAGKSSLVNALADASRQATAPIGDDGRGHHTTTHRELVVLPSGGLVLDTPGMRELRVWDDGVEGALGDVFDDVGAIASACRYRDCAHHGEPGCAIAAALARGELDPYRYANYEKLERETEALNRRKDVHAVLEAKRQMKVHNRAMRRRP